MPEEVPSAGDRIGRPVLKLSPLRSFVEIHDSNSFQEAARRLNVSQSAISAQIRLLETELAVTLFDRTARPPVMTELGRSILGPAREILTQVALIARLAASAGGHARALRLGVIPTLAAALLPDALVEMERISPELRVAVESGLSAQLAAEVRRGHLEAAVVTGLPEVTAGLNSMLVLRERLVLVARRGQAARLRLEGLVGQPFLRFHPNFGVGRIIDRLLVKRDIVPRELMQFDNVDAILAMAERGFGMAIVPEHAVLRSHRPGLVIAPIADAEATRDVLIVWGDQPGSAEVAATLADAMRAAASAGPAPEPKK